MQKFVYSDNYWAVKKRERRHMLGISKKYRSDCLYVSETDEYKRFKRKEYKARKKNGGVLTLKTIQTVYEDNIKKYGTLTCYLCLKPILFGKDHLEHRIPLSRGGTNIYSNLEVACQSCNCSKRNLTDLEYKEKTPNVQRPKGKA